MGSVALRQPQADGCVYQRRAAAAARWRLEVSCKLRETWSSDTRQPLNCQSSETASLNQTCRAGVTNKHAYVGFFFFFRPATEARFFIRRRPDQISTKPRSVHAHTRAVTHTQSPLTHLRVTSKETKRLKKKKKKKRNCRHIKPSVAFKA